MLQKLLWTGILKFIVYLNWCLVFINSLTQINLILVLIHLFVSNCVGNAHNDTYWKKSTQQGCCGKHVTHMPGATWLFQHVTPSTNEIPRFFAVTLRTSCCKDNCASVRHYSRTASSESRGKSPGGFSLISFCVAPQTIGWFVGDEVKFWLYWLLSWECILVIKWILNTKRCGKYDIQIRNCLRQGKQSTFSQFKNFTNICCTLLTSFLLVNIMFSKF